MAKYNLDELIALQQEIHQLNAQFNEPPYDLTGRLILLSAVLQFDLREKQPPSVVKNLAEHMPEVRDVLKQLLANQNKAA
jgi:hypothetical protein|nr:MAG TPA: hypothetical protein [Caudoviricetes sp.]